MTSNPNVLENPSNDLKCGLCHQTYTKPKILECLHSYCEKCIDDCRETQVYCQDCLGPKTKYQEQLVNATCSVCGLINQQYAYHQQLYTYQINGGQASKQCYYLNCGHHVCVNCVVYVIKCTECESSQEILKDGASALPTNFAIQKKLEIKKREKTSPYCQDCNEDKAISYCAECHLDLCSECANYHKRSKKFSRHQLTNIKEAPIERYFLDYQLCQKHHQNLRYYCDNCKVSVCNDCQLSSCHRGHQISLLSEVQQKIKDHLSSTLEEAESVKIILDGLVESGETFCQEIEEENKKSIELVKEIFAEVREVFKRREEEIIQQIHSESNKASFDKFCGSVDHLKELLKYIKSVGETSNTEINATLAKQVEKQLIKFGSKNIPSMYPQGFTSPTPMIVNLGGNQIYLENQGTQLSVAFTQDISFNLQKRIRKKATNCKQNLESVGKNFQVL